MGSRQYDFAAKIQNPQLHINRYFVLITWNQKFFFLEIDEESDLWGRGGARAAWVVDGLLAVHLLRTCVLSASGYIKLFANNVGL